MREADVLKEIEAWLKLRPKCFYFKVHGGYFQKKGLPDLIGCDRGRFFGIELKAPGKRPVPLQRYILSLITKAGGIAGYADSLEAFVKLIDIV